MTDELSINRPWIMSPRLREELIDAIQSENTGFEEHERRLLAQVDEFADGDVIGGPDLGDLDDEDLDARAIAGDAAAGVTLSILFFGLEAYADPTWTDRVE